MGNGLKRGHAPIRLKKKTTFTRFTAVMVRIRWPKFKPVKNKVDYKKTSERERTRALRGLASGEPFLLCTLQARRYEDTPSQNHNYHAVEKLFTFCENEAFFKFVGMFFTGWLVVCTAATDRPVG